MSDLQVIYFLMISLVEQEYADEIVLLLTHTGNNLKEINGKLSRILTDITVKSENFFMHILEILSLQLEVYLLNFLLVIVPSIIGEVVYLYRMSIIAKFSQLSIREMLFELGLIFHFAGLMPLGHNEFFPTRSL